MSRPRSRTGAALAVAAALLLLPGCGKSAREDGALAGGAPVAAAPAPPPARTRVEVVQQIGRKGSFNPSAIYQREALGVVTIISVYRGGGLGVDAGQGSGFVISPSGEIATNAHVVTNGAGSGLRRATSVYVQFSDKNQVPARIVGYDPNADVALLRVAPAGLTLRPLTLGSSAHLAVGSPVAAIGSPFGEAQSLSVGVISGLNRTIDSLNRAAGSETAFAITGAIQTDAAINHGNSGGPLVNARGEVIGINSQIQSTGGGGEGVGFAVPIDTVRRSIRQLRAHGHVAYTYLGVATVSVFPQLAERLGLPVRTGAFVQKVSPGTGAARAGLHAGTRTVRFQSQSYYVGGDVITGVNGKPVHSDTDLGTQVAFHRPGETVALEVWRAGKRRVVRVRLAERPLGSSSHP